MGITDHLTCLLRNLYAGQEAIVRNRYGTTVWFKIGKGLRQGNILSPCLLNLYAEYIMRNAGLDEAQLESRLLGEISITMDMQMIPPLWQKVKRNSKASFTFIKRLLSSSSLSAIRVVSSAYLRLLIFLPAILIPAVLPPAQRFSWCTLHRS